MSSIGRSTLKCIRLVCRSPSRACCIQNQQRRKNINVTRSLTALSNNSKKRSIGITRSNRRHHDANIKQGLQLTRDQIERIWNSFKIDDGDVFNIEEFVKDYPHVLNVQNPSQSSVQSNERSHSILQHNDGESNEDNLNNDVLYYEKQFQVVEEAEEKLKRMYLKVKAQENIPKEMRKQIQTLLMKELETVLEMWIHAANYSVNKTQCNDNNNDDELNAILALDRAKLLLLKFEAKYMIELEEALEDDDKSNLILDMPHTINYQKIISAYYNIYTKRERTMSQEALVNIQEHCSTLLKKMMKHIISRRMQALESVGDEEESQGNEQIIEQRGQFLLKTSYKQLISMYRSRIHMSTFTHEFKMVTLASKLLEEMESYYHDFLTVPTTKEENQTFLLSIRPTTRDFNNVIISYARLATKFHSLTSAKKAFELVNRMNLRHEAYARVHNINDIGAPNLTSFKAVLDAFASQKELTSEQLEMIENLLTIMDKYENLNHDESFNDLVNQCWLKCTDANEKNRFKRVNNIILSIEGEKTD